MPATTAGWPVQARNMISMPGMMPSQLCGGVGTATRLLRQLSQTTSPSLKMRSARSPVFTCADKTCYNPPQRRRALGAAPHREARYGGGPTATFQEE